jgi:tRNA A37 threonylcarbamoyladenosine biosynthesis protein TsaE
MNIVQAYTKFNKQNIILVSGFSGSGKTKLAKFLAELFGFKLINLSDFYRSDEQYDKPENYVTLRDSTKILDLDNIYRSIDWDKFNASVNAQKEHGIVVQGFGFPGSVIGFKPDFHIHIKINKENLFKNRNAYLETHPDAFGNKYRGTATEKYIFNDITYPHYIKIVGDSKIDKFINTNDMNQEQVKDSAFSYLMNVIEKWLADYNKKKVPVTQEYGTRTLKQHDDGNDYYYDDIYFPDKKRKLYDFNDQGIDYPVEYRKKMGLDKGEESISSSDSSEMHGKKHNKNSSSSSNSDAQFLFTTDTTISGQYSDQ